MSIRDLTDRIEGFDYQTGFEYCGEDDDFYAEMLSDYVAEEKDRVLNASFEVKDWHTYGIDVHALKTTSRMVGLLALGDKCEALQRAAEDEDEAYIIANHDDMIENYCECVEAIKEVLD